MRRPGEREKGAEAHRLREMMAEGSYRAPTAVNAHWISLSYPEGQLLMVLLPSFFVFGRVQMGFSACGRWKDGQSNRTSALGSHLSLSSVTLSLILISLSSPPSK